MASLIKKYLSSTNLGGVGQRWNSETDAVQYSPDGGTTWTDTPALDPRHADQYRLPPLTGENAQCDAAARIVGLWQEHLDLLYSTVNISQLATGVLGIILTLTGPVGWLVDLIIAGLEILITIGVSNIQAAFTSEVWDGVQCIIFNHIGTDGQVAAEERDAILADISALYPGTVYNTLVELINLYGEVLMSNAGVERTETGDCDACVTGTCYQVSYETALPEGTFHLFAGTYSAPNISQQCTGGFGSTSTLNFNQVLASESGAGCNYSRVEIDINPQVLDATWYIYGKETPDLTSGPITLLASGTASPGAQTVGDDVDGTLYYGLQVVVDTDSGCGTGDCYCTAVRIFSDNLTAAGLISNCDEE